MGSPETPLGVLLAVSDWRNAVRNLEESLTGARRRYRGALLDARTAGVSVTELARVVQSSESRVRQEMARAKEER